jgi:hypothetical protein
MKFAINPAGIQYKETFKGVAYRATLLQDGVAVACIQNDGNGGGSYLQDFEHDFDRKAFQAKAIEVSGLEELYIEDLLNIAEGV